MTLGEKQQLFVQLYSQWLVWALAQGYSFTFGEASRSDEQAEINAIGQMGRETVAQLVQRAFPSLALAIRNNGKEFGIRRSGHISKLALDQNLFINGVYQTNTEAWRPLGEYWEKLHPLCRWGGHFGDGNHISIEHDGVK